MSASKRFPWIIYWIAHAHGCQVDEGSVHPCVINGKDYGQLLYTLGVLGWLMTVPVGFLPLVALIVALIAHRVSWRKARRAAAKVPSG